MESVYLVTYFFNAESYDNMGDDGALTAVRCLAILALCY